MIGRDVSIAAVLCLPAGGSLTLPPNSTPEFAVLLTAIAHGPLAEPMPAAPGSAIDPAPVAAIAAGPILSDPEITSVPPATIEPDAATIVPVVSPRRDKALPGIETSRLERSVKPPVIDKAPVIAENATRIVDPLILANAPLPIFVKATMPDDDTTDIAKADARVPPIKTAPRQVAEAGSAESDHAVLPMVPPAPAEPLKCAPSQALDRTALPVAPALEMRSAFAATIGDRLSLHIVDRLATFAPIIADTARDLAAVARDKDVRFNVRPDMLGHVAVTIERSEAGQRLRLGVETQAAVQAVRQAEPLLNDARGSAHFVQVTVDMNAPENRGRSPRAMTPQRAPQDHVSEPTPRRPSMTTSRYA